MSLACLLAPISATYRRREPETSPLYKAVQAHLETFLATHDVPGHVRGSTSLTMSEAFRRFLGCGVLAKGFVRVRCRQCGDESLVAFSCKDRGFCPSCTAPLMVRLSNHVAPRRQLIWSTTCCLTCRCGSSSFHFPSTCTCGPHVTDSCRARC